MADKPWTPPNSLNRLMTWMLRTPGIQNMVGKSTLLLTYRGRRTGLVRTIPLSYVERPGWMVVSAHPSRQWYRSLETLPEVTIRVRGEKREAIASIVSGDDALEDLTALFEAQPMLAKGVGVRMEDGSANVEDVRAQLASTVVVRLAL